MAKKKTPYWFERSINPARPQDKSILKAQLKNAVKYLASGEPVPRRTAQVVIEGIEEYLEGGKPWQYGKPGNRPQKRMVYLAYLDLVIHDPLHKLNQEKLAEHLNISHDSLKDHISEMKAWKKFSEGKSLANLHMLSHDQNIEFILTIKLDYEGLLRDLKKECDSILITPPDI